MTSPTRANSIIQAAFQIPDRVAVITGGGRGIGRACALTLAEAGAKVVLCSRTESDLAEVQQAIRTQGREALTLQLDIGAEDAPAQLIESAVNRFGRIDILVNNAGGSPPRPLLETSVTMLERAFHFNVSTAFAVSQRALPYLLESGGSIINITSAIGRLTDRGMVAYGTAKAALSHMTRLMANECAPRVRVNGIAAGAIETSALQSVLSDELRTAMESGTPLRRLGTPQDIAFGALYLASPAGSYITGKILEIDGGIEAPNLKLGLPDLSPTGH